MTQAQLPPGFEPSTMDVGTTEQAFPDVTHSVAAQELRKFIERWEQLNAEKKDIANAQKDIMAEAKGCGYDTKVMRLIIALRERDSHDIAEQEAIEKMYKQALGM